LRLAGVMGFCDIIAMILQGSDIGRESQTSIDTEEMVEGWPGVNDVSRDVAVSRGCTGDARKKRG
jgi:hypothetical protein